MVKFYEVGGHVRDKLLGLKSKDIDYAVEAPTLDEVISEIQKRRGEIFLIHEEFFTVRAKIPEHGVADYVWCRRDGPYSDGRHPDYVEPGTIYDDLARRDFTMNAIAISEDGTVIDPHNGRKDIEDRIISCVGNAIDRLTEDPLRQLRAIRFMVTKGFVPDRELDYVLENPVSLSSISSDRIRQELLMMFKHDTWMTLCTLHSEYGELSSQIFYDRDIIWLKPTTEAR